MHACCLHVFVYLFMHCPLALQNLCGQHYSGIPTLSVARQLFCCSIHPVRYKNPTHQFLCCCAHFKTSLLRAMFVTSFVLQALKSAFDFADSELGSTAMDLSRSGTTAVVSIVTSEW